MSADDLLETLIAAAVVEPTDDGRGIRLHPSLRDAVDRYRDRLGSESVATVLGERSPDGLPTGAFDAPAGEEFWAQYCAVREAAPSLPPGVTAQSVTVVDALRRGPPADGGAPDRFLPVRGDVLGPLAHFHRAAIAYVWRRDSRDCDLMRSELEALDDAVPEDVTRFAVSLDESADALDATYDVTMAPTTLFVLDGTVDARLVGPQYRGPIANEIRYLRDHR